MLGAIIGDIVGSRFEFNNTHSKEFEFFHKDCRITDDSAMTIAVMATILESNLDNEEEYKKNLIENFRMFYQMYPQGDYGLGFVDWLNSADPKPYNSYGNGSCMRISPVAVLDGGVRTKVARWTTEVSHNHPIALAWVQLFITTLAMVKDMDVETSKEYIRKALVQTTIRTYRYSYYVDGVPKVYPGEFDETVQGTVPLAVQAVLDSSDFVDAIRTAVSYGGDSDTIACIAGALAEAVYGIPMSIRRKAMSYIPITMLSVVQQFIHRYVFG